MFVAWMFPRFRLHFYQRRSTLHPVSERSCTTRRSYKSEGTRLGGHRFQGTIFVLPDSLRWLTIGKEKTSDVNVVLIQIKKWFVLCVRLSNYGCTQEVGRAQEKRFSGTRRS